MGKEKLVLVLEARAQAGLLWGPNGQVQCKAGRRDGLPVAAEGPNSSTR